MATPASSAGSRAATGSSASGPTSNQAAVLAAQASEIQQLKEQMAELIGQLQVQAAGTVATNIAPKMQFKVPELFDGDKEKLKPFLTNMDLYCRYNKQTLATDQDKILAAGMHMTRRAAKWMQPLTDDYLKNENTITKYGTETKKTFKD
ncbi:hypothetical protein PSPO01_08816 [Paraphaeosphaeria sporulosa]